MSPSGKTRHPQRRGLALLLLAVAGNALSAGPDDADTMTAASLRLPDEAQWAAQRERVRGLLAQLLPDVIAIHNVWQSPQQPNPACWLASQLDYACDFVTADPPSQPARHGNALLTRHSVIDDGTTLLHGPDQFTAAGMQRLQLGRHLVNVYVVRIHPQPDQQAAREHQAADLRAWIASTDGGQPALIVGDFAAPTDELVRQLPGFQPARRNPSARAAHAGDTARGQSHGLDVLYQVRNFADVGQRSLKLGRDGGTPLPLGLMATIRFTSAPGKVVPAP